jgi:hypothetical protein
LLRSGYSINVKTTILDRHHTSVKQSVIQGALIISQLQAPVTSATVRRILAGDMVRIQVLAQVPIFGIWPPNNVSDRL